MIRRDAAGQVQRIALCRGKSLRVGDLAVTLKTKQPFIEIVLAGGRASVVAGDPDSVKDIRTGDKSIWRR